MTSALSLLSFCFWQAAIQCISLPLKKSEYCHGKECPLYFIAKKMDGYELRCYRSSVWLSVTENGNYDGSSFVGNAMPTWRLFHFIHSFHPQDRHQLLGGLLTYTFDEYHRRRSVSIMVPHRLARDIKELNRTGVDVVYRRPFCAYVFNFSGWVGHSFTVKGKEKLYRKHLAEKGVAGDCYSKFYIFSRYAQHNAVLHTTNEIWFIVRLELSAAKDDANVADISTTAAPLTERHSNESVNALKKA